MTELIKPEQLAQDLTDVYHDPEASAFERNMAIAGLTTFWLGVEVAKLTAVLQLQDGVEATDE